MKNLKALKTIAIVICVAGIGIATLSTNIEQSIYEVAEIIKTFTRLHKNTNLQYTEDHARHDDLVHIEGKIWCKKTQSFYRL